MSCTPCSSDFTWIPLSTFQCLPHSAVHAGTDSDGTPMYVGRASHEGDQITAKVMPCKKAAYVSYNGVEIFKQNFEVLVGTGFKWVAANNGQTPAGAVSSGKTSCGEALYIGRANHDGSLTVGKIHKSHNCLYIAYGGKEHSIKQYEVLVMPQRPNWVNCSAGSSAPPGAILGGTDVDGSHIYVGRAQHGNDQLVAKVIPSNKIAYVCYDGKEIAMHNFEVLCNGNVQWQDSQNGHVPPNAVAGGRTESGETLYIGRSRHQGSLTVGKIHPSHGCLYFPFGGSEISTKKYEILVEN